MIIEEIETEINLNGVQGHALKILPEIHNIFKDHPTTGARYNAMKQNWSRLFAKAMHSDRTLPVAANTFSGTLVTNFLIQGAIQKATNRFAAAKLFSRDTATDPLKPLATGIRKFNTTATDGSQVQTDATDFEGLGSGGDSIIDPLTIVPHQYTSGGHITNAQLQSGFRLDDIIGPKITDLAAKITQVITAPITIANFVTNAPLLRAPAAFGFSDLANLQGSIKKADQKNLIIDGDYITRISNVPGFYQKAGTLDGDTRSWEAYGFDNIAQSNDWTGAGTDVAGLACGPNAIGTIFGLPVDPPEGMPGVRGGVAVLPGVNIGIATYFWFASGSRTSHFTFDIIAAAVLVDETVGQIVKRA